MASGLVEFPGDVALTFDCGMWTAFRNVLEIVGSDGSIYLPKAYLYDKNEDGDADFFVRTSSGERREKADLIDIYALQADGRRGVLKAVVRVTNPDATGIERAYPHAIAVCLRP